MGRAGEARDAYLWQDCLWRNSLGLEWGIWVSQDLRIGLGYAFTGSRPLPGEEEAFLDFRTRWIRPLDAEGIAFREGPLENPDDVLAEIAEVGRRTVERGLVDSFFGNISCRIGGVIYISQTAASLDELAGCIDPVPADNSTTAGITASSELAAHRAIYDATGARTILHAHPRFAVAMSMLCEENGCSVTDCWRDCDRVQMMGDTPVVAGEIGAGGLAKRVPPVIGGPGKAVVYGHGVFAVGMTGFRSPFQAVVDVLAVDSAHGFCILRVPLKGERPEFTSLANAIPAVNWQEREIQVFVDPDRLRAGSCSIRFGRATAQEQFKASALLQRSKRRDPRIFANHWSNRLSLIFALEDLTANSRAEFNPIQNQLTLLSVVCGGTQSNNR